MTRRITPALFAFAGAAATISAACQNSVTGPEARASFEVWAIDQSPSPGRSFGGLLHIFRDSIRADGTRTLAGAAEVVDLGAATAALCQSATGAAPVQAHNITFNRSESHALIAFMASAHVAILDARTRQPVACLQMTPGAAGMRHAHQAVAARDGSYILVANQMGKLIERITANFATNTFTLNPSATLNLATCRTPSGAACESAARPNNQPVTFTIDDSGDLAFVTLRGGGFLAIDARSTPMQIRAEYDVSTIQPQGLASIRVGNELFTSSGANAFRVYRFALNDYSRTTAPPPNSPAPAVLTSDATTGRDGHGMAASDNGQYLWVTDRGGNSIEIFDLGRRARVNTISLAGALSSDPAPDLLGLAPGGDLMFVTLKGPTPLSGIPWGTGATPGVGIIAVEEDGRGGRFVELRPLTNRDAGNVERADPHGLAVRKR